MADFEKKQKESEEAFAMPVKGESNPEKDGKLHVANWSKKCIQKVGMGKVQTVYESKDGWSPTDGVFDKQGRLWALECNKKMKFGLYVLLRTDVDSKQ